MADAVSVSFSDWANIWGAEFTLSRGVSPSVATLYLLPPTTTLTAAAGTLTFLQGATTVSFDDMLPVLTSLRMERRGGRRLWSVQIVDRRREWQGGYIEGVWNPRLVTGEIPDSRKKNAKELIEYILGEIGETGYDTSDVPTSVYPYLAGPIRWDLALAYVCERVACEVCPQSDGTFAIKPLGSGASLPATGHYHPTFTFKPADRPTEIVVRGGPSLYQSKLTLAAMSYDSTGDYVGLASAAHRPASTAYDSPAFFGRVAQADRWFALETDYRLFRVTGQAQGGLTVPGCSETINGVDQYLPLKDHLLITATDPLGNENLVRATVEGTYWPQSDYPANTGANVGYPGRFDIWPAHGMVLFEYPVVALNSDGTFTQPSLYLTTTYTVQKADGSGPVALEVTDSVTGGSGPAKVLHIPEIFETVIATYSGNLLTGTTTNTTAAENELEAYAAMHAAAAEGMEHKDVKFTGLVATNLDGLLAQVKYSTGIDTEPYTRISSGFEFDIYNPSLVERRRVELLEQLKEYRG